MEISSAFPYTQQRMCLCDTEEGPGAMMQSCAFAHSHETLDMGELLEKIRFLFCAQVFCPYLF